MMERRKLIAQVIERLETFWFGKLLISSGQIEKK